MRMKFILKLAPVQCTHPCKPQEPWTLDPDDAIPSLEYLTWHMSLHLVSSSPQMPKLLPYGCHSQMRSMTMPHLYPLHSCNLSSWPGLKIGPCWIFMPHHSWSWVLSMVSGILTKLLLKVLLPCLWDSSRSKMSWTCKFHVYEEIFWNFFF